MKSRETGSLFLVIGPSRGRGSLPISPLFGAVRPVLLLSCTGELPPEEEGVSAVCSPFIREAQLQESTGDKVRCLTCERRCELADGQVGWCRTRENRDGTLYTLIYGAVSSLSCNPIEKKPLYHFYPGSVALTAGSWSCNFACP